MDKIEQDTDRDFWLNPSDAKAYGLIDEILDGTERGGENGAKS